MVSTTTTLSHGSSLWTDHASTFSTFPLQDLAFVVFIEEYEHVAEAPPRQASLLPGLDLGDVSIVDGARCSFLPAVQVRLSFALHMS
jgi:hypothetical protein